MGYCCGERDCKIAVVSIVEFKKDSILANVEGILLDLPPKSVKESEDGHTYWCAYNENLSITKENTRCIFYTIGS